MELHYLTEHSVTLWHVLKWYSMFDIMYTQEQQKALSSLTGDRHASNLPPDLYYSQLCLCSGWHI